MHGSPEVIARGPGVLGEVVLRCRGAVHELIVNGAFLMDTAETSTERLLGDALLDLHPAPRRVLVGGLGFGLTVAALLADARVERVDVAEIEPLLVKWLRCGLVPAAGAVLDDPRVNVEIAGVLDTLERAPARSYDAVLLDVDNGPAFLVHADNAAVYQRPALARAARSLAPGGVLGVWSAAAAPDLGAILADVVGPCEDVVRTVRREGRELSYHLYLATLADRP